MSNSSKIVVVDNRLKGIAWKDIYEVDPEALAPDLAALVWEIWHVSCLLEEAREPQDGMDPWDADWRDREGEEGRWEAAMAAYNS